MEMPNSRAVVVGKADEVVELPIPEWAMESFAPGPVPVLSPLDMKAGSMMMATGFRNAQGKRVWPWQKKRMSRGSYEMAQGRQMVYSPVGKGVRLP